MRSRCFGCSFLLFSFICSVALSQSVSPRKERSRVPVPLPLTLFIPLSLILCKLKCTVKFQIQIQIKRRRLENLTGAGATPSPSPWDAPRQSWTTFRPSLSAATAAGSSKKRFAIATPSPMHTWLTCSLSRLLAPLSISFSIILVLVPIITAITMLLLHQTAIMQPKSQYLLHLIALPRV